MGLIGRGVCDICNRVFEGNLDVLVNHRNNGYPSCGKKRHFNSVERYYVHDPIKTEEVCLQGPLEYSFASWCFDHGISWTRPSKPFIYSRNIDKKENNNLTNSEPQRRIQRYYPDFYLPECDTFIETKGKYSEKDVEKMASVTKEHPFSKLCLIRTLHPRKLE